MSEETRAIGYICPDCGKPVYAERTAFALSAAAVGVVCACGHGELTAEPAGDTYRITVPCGVCGGEHRAEVPAKKLLRGGGVALACPQTRQLCCYIGDVYRVEAALRDLEIAAEKKKDITARDGVSCVCGGRGCSMEVSGAAVDLICPDCGGRLRVPAATSEDLDRLCCQYTLTIRGRG